MLKLTLPVIVLVIAGASDILLLKVTDKQEARGVDGTTRKFDQPLLQSETLFLGQLGCLAIFKLFERRQYKPSPKLRMSINPGNSSEVEAMASALPMMHKEERRAGLLLLLFQIGRASCRERV